MATSGLPDLLQRALAAASPPALCVAFSGGPDSTALLHALAQLQAARARGLRALHIDHGLHADSATWAQHCAEFCLALAVPLTTVRVAVDRDSREGLEAAARHVRYAAFAGQLRDGEWLTLAHHRNDQVETVLLKLLRGAGPEGLGGMRTLRPFGNGKLWRPLLETPREAIDNYLLENHISPVNDPSNRDARWTRNWLRLDLLPRIRQRNPAADAAILHTAQLCQAAADYINTAATAARLQLTQADGTLDAAGWLALPPALRAPVLDEWLRAHELATPPDAARTELEHQARGAASDRVPLITWDDVEVRVWRGRLYAHSRLPPYPASWKATWNGALLVLPAGCGALTLTRADGAALPGQPFATPLTVRLPQGGERLRPAGKPHRRGLDDLFREAHVPPWWRPRCPLICAGSELLAAGDVAMSAAGEAHFAALGVRPRWQRPGAR